MAPTRRGASASLVSTETSWCMHSPAVSARSVPILQPLRQSVKFSIEQSARNMFDTERLISAVEERRCLWDASHEDYKNRDKRLKEWKEVAEDIVPDYGDMEEGEPRLLTEKSSSSHNPSFKTARSTARCTARL